MYTIRISGKPKHGINAFDAMEAHGFSVGKKTELFFQENGERYIGIKPEVSVTANLTGCSSGQISAREDYGFAIGTCQYPEATATAAIQNFNQFARANNLSVTSNVTLSGNGYSQELLTAVNALPRNVT